MMKDRGIRPEMELFHPGHYWVINDLISQALVEKPYKIQFVLGSITASYASPWNLMNLIQELLEKNQGRRSWKYL
jgi:3-keto-5-aminohexanoate cleavage enzyme